jgi:hypothetical protein
MKTPSLPQDELFQIERRIAQRADELSRTLGTDRLHALDNWRRAESEVWEQSVKTHSSSATRELHLA